MRPAIFLSLGACLLSQVACAQTPSPTLTSPAPGWQFYAEAGPKASWFRNVNHGTTYLVFAPGTPATYYREFQVNTTYAAFADVRALKALAPHWLVSGTAGFDMQQLDFTTTWRAALAPRPDDFVREHVVRLLTRVRLDAGLHYAIGLGGAGQLRPGVSLGQLVNVSRNGFSYTFLQPELSYTYHQVLLAARASFMPYNTTIPDVDDIARRDERVAVERNEYRISELQLSIGIKL
jgi:hypothetical protein